MESFYSLAFETINASHERTNIKKHPGMHLTNSIDYIVLLKGKVKLILDNDEISLKGILYLIGVQELNFGIKQFDIKSSKQGIVHVIGPELGYTLPGMTIVCGDSHTSTHGALGCLAMGIGTSEVEHVLATQCLKVSKLKNMIVKFEGIPAENVTSKDIVLYFIGFVYP